MCPGHLLQGAAWAYQLLHWWQFSSPWDGMSGQPCGPPEWPEPGGMMNQDAWLVDVVTLLRAEWSHVERRAPDRPATEAGASRWRKS